MAEESVEATVSRASSMIESYKWKDLGHIERTVILKEQ